VSDSMFPGRPQSFIPGYEGDPRSDRPRLSRRNVYSSYSLRGRRAPACYTLITLIRSLFVESRSPGIACHAEPNHVGYGGSYESLDCVFPTYRLGLSLCSDQAFNHRRTLGSYATRNEAVDELAAHTAARRRTRPGFSDDAQ
jgi:hypothetical protein